MQNIDLDNLTDDELASMDLSTLAEVSDTTDEHDTESDQTDSENTANDDVSDDEYEEDTQQDDESNQQADETLQGTQQDIDDESNADDEQTDESDEVDYRGFYETLTKPFKANGREIQVTNPNDMIALMQQGANYSKKMAELKPNLAIVKALKDNGLADVKDVGYLVDLYNKKPEAIAKLIKDANIDLYDFDTAQAEGYKPTQVNEPTQLESIVSELYESSDSFKQVATQISTNWDTRSKDILVEKPQLLYVLAEQAESGLYQHICETIEYERMLGRMVNTPFIEAYSAIEAQILANQSQQQQALEQQFTAPRPKPTQTTQPTNQVDKRKASSPKGGVSDKESFNPLELSDDEFLKFYAQQKFH